MEKLKCPECNSESISKNGKPGGRKPQYLCKDCSRYFTEDSSKGFPRTSLPFPFVAFILYILLDGKLFNRKKHSGMKRVVVWVNHTLPYLKFKKKSVTRKTIYQWMKNYGDTYKEKVRWGQAFNFFQDSKERKIEPRKFLKHEISDYLKSQPMPSYQNLGELSLAYFGELHKIKQNPSKKPVPLVPELFNVHMSFKISRHPIDIYKTMENNYNHPMMKMDWLDSLPNVIKVVVLDGNATRKRITKYRSGEVSLWTSGKCTFTGGGNIKLAKETIKIITTNFSENDPNIIKSPRIKINNISAKIELLRKISRNALLFALHGQDFEEKNNSCRTGKITSINKNNIELKMKSPNVFIEFYESGTVIIHGAKKEDDIDKAVEKLSTNFWLTPFLNQHKL